ncbi:MAG: hypothetical protein IPK32_22555 [Verrucomicrobiaceae bacterium]|nr:hypothetical protein [Verrucomicrobiaceae bacterium]
MKMLLSTLIFFLPAASALAQIQNGSFEQGTSFVEDFFLFPETSDSSAPDYWGRSAGSTRWVKEKTYYNTPLPEVGNPGGLPTPWDVPHFIAGEFSPTTSGYLWQDLALNGTYQLDFSFASGGLYNRLSGSVTGNIAPGGWSVQLTDLSTMSSQSYGSFTTNASGLFPMVPDQFWSKGSTQISSFGGSGNYRLTFSAIGQNNESDRGYAFIDGVSLAIVPEPASGLLAMFSSFFLLNSRRRGSKSP